MSLPPLGQEAVGCSVARDFGESEGGIFNGVVDSARLVRTRWIYHILYEDGDEEEMDADEFQYAYELAIFEAGGEFYDEDVDEQFTDHEDSEFESKNLPPKKKHKSSAKVILRKRKQEARGLGEFSSFL